MPTPLVPSNDLRQALDRSADDLTALRAEIEIAIAQADRGELEDGHIKEVAYDATRRNATEPPNHFECQIDRSLANSGRKSCTLPQRSHTVMRHIESL